MKYITAVVPFALALVAMASPIDLQSRQAQPQCNMANCVGTIVRTVPGFLSPCGAAAQNLQGIQMAQSQGQPPSQANAFGLVANGAQCVAVSISAGFSIPAACQGCPGTSK